MLLLCEAGAPCTTADVQHSLCVTGRLLVVVTGAARATLLNLLVQA